MKKFIVLNLLLFFKFYRIAAMGRLIILFFYDNIKYVSRLSCDYALLEQLKNDRNNIKLGTKRFLQENN